MKGIHGLIVAAVLGALGAALNAFYLQGKTKGFDTISFLGVKDGVQIKRGDKFTRDMFAEVKIPERAALAGNLVDFVYRYADLETIVGLPATRAYHGGELLYREQIVTAPTRLVLAPGERAMEIKVDSSFAHALLNPGDMVDFRVPVLDESGRTVPDRFEDIGPFEIKAVDGRLGGVETTDTLNRRQVESVTIVVSGGEAEQRANTLLDRIARTGSRGAKLILRGPEEN